MTHRLQRNSLLTSILREVTAVSIGCTEPAAIALAAAAARSAIGEGITRISISLDANTYKNALTVAIPNTGGKNGIQLAAALGALFGDSRLGLKIFENVTEENTRTAEHLVMLGQIEVTIRREQPPLFIEATVETASGYGRAIISGTHTNIALLEANGVVKAGSKAAITRFGKETFRITESQLLAMKTPDLVRLTAELTPADIALLWRGAEMNLAIARDGLARKSGLSIGAALKDLVDARVISNNGINEAKVMVAAGVDARMSGSNLPVMTNGGSGNQGITATLPVLVMSKRLKSSRLEVARALAISHLLAAYTRLKIGELSTLCGSSVAGAIGATAGTLWLMNQGEELIGEAVKNVVGNIPGILCDGANSLCALKLATASGVAVENAFLLCQGVKISTRTGIIANGATDTYENLALISKSLRETERTILNIMTRDDV